MLRSAPRVFRVPLCTLTLWLVVASSLASAQAIYGTLAGRVLDPSRAPVADVAVTAIDVATNVPLATVTNAEGASGSRA